MILGSSEIKCKSVADPDLQIHVRGGGGGGRSNKPIDKWGGAPPKAEPGVSV